MPVCYHHKFHILTSLQASTSEGALGLLIKPAFSAFELSIVLFKSHIIHLESTSEPLTRDPLVPRSKEKTDKIYLKSTKYPVNEHSPASQLANEYSASEHEPLQLDLGAITSSLIHVYIAVACMVLSALKFATELGFRHNMLRDWNNF